MQIKFLQRKNVLMSIAAIFLMVLASVNVGTTQARDTGNDIISGGVSSVSNLKHKFNNGDGRHSASDIQKIFKEAIGVTSASQFDGMKSGYVYRNGNVTVNGKVVATDAHSTGRHSFRNSKRLGNTNAFYERTSVRFSSGTTRIPAFVKLDKHGEFEFAVIKECGNPSWAKAKPVEKPQPKAAFECKDLEADVTRGTEKLEVTFTATAEVENTEVESYIFDFGDGETETTTSRTVTHTYDKPGEYTATVQVRTKDGTTKEVSRCAVTIKVKEKPQPKAAFECTDLTLDYDRKAHAPLRVDMTARADAENTEIEEYTFVIEDEDGDVVERITVTSSSETVEATHVFDQAGTYTVYVTVETEDGTTERISDCEKQLTVDEKPVVEKPGKGEAPKELPNTGVAETAAGLTGSASLGVAVRSWVRSRKDLLSTLLNK